MDIEVRTYRAFPDRLSPREVSSSLLEELTALTARSVCAQSPQGAGSNLVTRDGLAHAIPPELFQRWLSIPGARLQTCVNSGSILGFSLYFIDGVNLPDDLRHLQQRARPLLPYTYAHLIVVDPECRGRRLGIYDHLVRASRSEIPPETTAAVAWVRSENQHAMRAHVSRGWVRSGLTDSIAIRDVAHHGEYLVLPLTLSWEKLRRIFV